MINLNPNLNFNHPQPQINISNSTKKEININRTNLDILLSQNDILPLLKRVNHQSKILGRQVTLSEFVQQKNVVSIYLNSNLILKINIIL
jgi:hypothetical protein